MINVLLLTAGIFALLYGANWLVDGASSFARRMNVSDMVIGLTIVAFGTSAPELVVNLVASLRHNSDIALGNVVGSNIFNILAILGVCALIRPVEVKSATARIEIPLGILAALTVLVMAGDSFFDEGSHSVISRIDGMVLMLFFLVFLFYNAYLVMNYKEKRRIKTRDYSLFKSVVMIVAGLLLLAGGGRAIVVSASEIARMIGITEKVIALTIVSAGTSLPELAASVVAIKKKNHDIAIGNVVGSNIFNTFLILGLSAVIYPVSLTEGLQIDLFVNILASLLLLVFVFTGRGRKLDRWEGAIFIFIYAAFITALLLM